MGSVISNICAANVNGITRNWKMQRYTGTQGLAGANWVRGCSLGTNLVGEAKDSAEMKNYLVCDGQNDLGEPSTYRVDIVGGNTSCPPGTRQTGAVNKIGVFEPGNNIPLIVKRVEQGVALFGSVPGALMKLAEVQVGTFSLSFDPVGNPIFDINITNPSISKMIQLKTTSLSSWSFSDQGLVLRASDTTHEVIITVIAGPNLLVLNFAVNEIKKIDGVQCFRTVNKFTLMTESIST